jgi:hypothetical protein
LAKGITEMAFPAYIQKETQTQETRAKLQEYLDPFNRATPRPFPDEDATSYENRALPSLQQCLNGELKDVKIHQVHGKARDVLVDQIYNAAAREARNPTNIPEGELREVKTADATGRVSSEFYGDVKAWLNDFHSGKRRLVGIRTETERGFVPSNIS